MDSGVRVSHTKPNGEREILDDAGRAAELKRIQIVMDTKLQVMRRGRSTCQPLPRQPLVTRLGPGALARKQAGLARTPCLTNRARRASLGSTVSGR